MKKEHVFLITVCLFIFAYVLGYLAGPVAIHVTRTPYSFLFDPISINRLPLTSFEILVRSLAIFISIGLIFSLFEKKYFTKAIIIFVIAFLAQLYSIQQVMMRGTLTTMQWTLPISFAGILSILWVIYHIFQGVIHGVNDKLIKKDRPQTTSSNDESILKPN